MQEAENSRVETAQTLSGLCSAIMQVYSVSNCTSPTMIFTIFILKYIDFPFDVEDMKCIQHRKNGVYDCGGGIAGDMCYSVG